jgi:putative ABC transport system permease protein
MPLFTTVAVATLAIGIGANAAIFSVIDGVLLSPLPYPDPGPLVSLSHSALGIGIKDAGTAPFLHFTYQDEGRAFSSVGIWRGDSVSVTGRAEPEQVDAVDVSEGVLRTLGVQPVLGRAFIPADDTPDGPETVILTAGYWRGRLGGDAAIVGQRLTIDGRPREIIGVMPETFRFLDRKPALILPLRLDLAKTFLGNFSYSGLARLRPGVSLAAANADVTRMIPVALKRFPPFPGFTVKTFEDARLAAGLRPLKEQLVGDIGSVLWVLMGTIGLVLLIACANVANLLLVRAEGRQQELAIRAALGAGWQEITRELLLESVTLGLVGGALGLGLAYGGLRAFVAVAPANLPRLDQISINGMVLVFTLAISLLGGVLLGLFPVMRYLRPELTPALRGGGRSASASKERHRVRNTLVVVQVALALVLLVGSGLMIRTFQALKHVRPGFANPSAVQTFRLSIPESQLKQPDDVARMEQAIADRIAGLPGVSAVGLTNNLPMSGGGWRDPIFAEDRAPAESEFPPLRRFRFVSPQLFSAMGIPVVAGRDFTWIDVFEERQVVVVSENLARELWQRPDAALGKRIHEGPQGSWREIIGVVGDVRDDGVDHPAPSSVYWPVLMSRFEGNAAFIQRFVVYTVRTPRAGSSSFVDEVSRAVWSINPNLPLASVRTLGEVYESSMARTSFTLIMLAIAGAMALLLGTSGVYGVISYAVSQQTREVGIRIALGAQRGEVTRMFVAHGLRLAAIGIAVGLIAAAGLTRVMSSLLFDVKASDPATYGAVAIGLTLTVALASYIPALQAATIDPLEALRAE